MGKGQVRIEYDREVDILYIRFRESRIANTIPISDDVYMDLDEKEKPVGIEIWRASENAISPLSPIIAAGVKATLEKAQ
jgi:uncharacterized protein YuzE